MILLLTPSERASQCAAALYEATREKISVAESPAHATAILRSQPCRAVVIDQYLLDTEPDEAAVAMAHIGNAVMVPVNLALSGLPRLVAEVRASLKRRRREEVSARDAAIAKLHSVLNGTVTALQLSIQLALQATAISTEASEKLHAVRDLVTKLRHQLEASGAMEDVESVATC
jgi:hypothetical protein